MPRKKLQPYQETAYAAWFSGNRCQVLCNHD